jgi:ribosomal protein S18 acetylase RimI-like enzyme
MQTTGNRAFELGFGAAVLEVDSENPTGALGVYRKAGFEVSREFVSYEFTASGA